MEISGMGNHLYAQFSNFGSPLEIDTKKIIDIWIGQYWQKWKEVVFHHNLVFSQNVGKLRIKDLNTKASTLLV